MNGKTTQHPNENIARLCWIAFVLMFFVLQACLWTYAILATAGDRSHAVVPGYDEQALTWDEVKQARSESAALGWSAKVYVDQAADIRGNRSVTIQLTDKKQEPVSNVTLKLTAFHRAAVADPQEVAFEQIAPGIYASTLDVDRFGKWCFSGTATRDGETWLLDEKIVINKPTTTAMVTR